MSGQCSQQKHVFASNFVGLRCGVDQLETVLNIAVVYGTDLLPSFGLYIADCVYVAAVSTGLLLARAEAKRLRHWISGLSAPPRVVPSSELTWDLELLAVRAARLRQQHLHDMVVMANRAYGWYGGASVLAVAFEAPVSLYIGILVLVGRRKSTLEAFDDPIIMLWGLALLARLIGLCVLGQLLSDCHTEMYHDLEGLLVCRTNISASVKQEHSEVYGFVQQIQRQDNRCGVLGLTYFDAKSILTVAASVTTYTIVLSQFDLAT
ncbi:hypothetical protein ONE63_011310 [Megalurothrips usitatus]|uniref:Gustatory receptor n=1 Tax=Megalurothrips usitatus TaxID=439358 RepID=A0AAV7X3S4_9NEOP|nr:hypothetical protein ONE63_011310 [Megalurothrips usitatus]